MIKRRPIDRLRRIDEASVIELAHARDILQMRNNICNIIYADRILS